MKTICRRNFSRAWWSKSNAFGKMDDLFKKRESIKIKDKAAVATKLDRLIKDGPEKLQIVTDFDYTITKSRTSASEVGLLTHGILADRLVGVQNEKYGPIENATNLTVEEKIPHMVDWWQQSHEMFAQLRFKKSDLDNFVKESNLEIRENSMEFVRHTEDSGIPVLIFSGGLGDLIHVVLKQHLGRLPSNIRTVSNFMKFDEKGIIAGFDSPVIHTFNKNAAVLRSNRGEFVDRLRSRPNVVLIGDSLGDLDMDDGIENKSVVLKIGFFDKEPSKSALDSYLDGYDIVFVNDQTFEVPLAILKSIINSKTD